MFVFRVDSSTQIGSGHLMRCLTLAKQLKNNADVMFISRDLEGNLNKLVKKNGYKLLTLPKVQENNNLVGYEKWLTAKTQVDAEQTKNLLITIDVGCLIIDSYAIGEEWENIVRPYVKKIMVIDDLANRRHNCDILLDQNYYCDMNTRYNKLVPVGCQLLLGPQYVLLREEFYEARKKIKQRIGRIQNILVFFGGSDLTNETLKALYALNDIRAADDIRVNVVVGNSNKNKDRIQDYCLRKDNFYYYCQVNNMAELMNEADLAIGAAGTAVWERCFLQVPAIVISIAENQKQGIRDFAKLGMLTYLGHYDTVNKMLLQKTIQEFLNNKLKYTKVLEALEKSELCATAQIEIVNKLTQ